MLEKIKALLGIEPADTSKDIILSFLMESVSAKAKRYCKLDGIPADMESLLIEIIVSRFRAQNYGSTDLPVTVTNVSDNGQSVGFKVTGSEDITASGFTRAEEKMLNLWRKLW